MQMAGGGIIAIATAPGGQIDAGEHDLTHPFVNSVFDLLDNLLLGNILVPAPCQTGDAEAALIITTGLN